MAADEYTSNLFLPDCVVENRNKKQFKAPNTIEAAWIPLDQTTKARLASNSESKQDPDNENTWKELYPVLRSFAKHCVHSFKVSCWDGQEDDIVEDIVQESARRILEYSRRAQRQEVKPINSLERILWAVVRNCCIDLRRRDSRLVHTRAGEYVFERESDQSNPLDKAIENMYYKEIFTLLACKIAHFPKKQRRALLIDLANRMSFDAQPTPLQEAFMTAGLDLHEYRQPLPENYVERSRHAALLTVAYKRIARLFSV